MTDEAIFPEYEVFRKTAFVTHIRPKGARCWTPSSYPNERGRELVEKLDKYRELAVASHQPNSWEHTEITALALILLDQASKAETP